MRWYRDNAAFLDNTASLYKCWRCLRCWTAFINKTPWSWSSNKVEVKTPLKQDIKTVSCLRSTILNKKEKIVYFLQVLCLLCCKLFHFGLRFHAGVSFTSGTCNSKKFHTGLKFHAGVSFTSPTCNQPLSFTSLCFTSLRFASLHFASLHFASLHMKNLHILLLLETSSLLNRDFPGFSRIFSKGFFCCFFLQFSKAKHRIWVTPIPDVTFHLYSACFYRDSVFYLRVLTQQSLYFVYW